MLLLIHKLNDRRTDTRQTRQQTISGSNIFIFKFSSAPITLTLLVLSSAYYPTQ
jgi:hypothetical protein